MKNRHKFTLLGILLVIGGYYLSMHGPFSTPTAELNPLAEVNTAAVSAAPEPPPVQAADEDYEPKPGPKVTNLVRRAISEKWPNIQMRALISMTQNPELIAELWKREPLEAQDLCVLAMHSTTPEDKLKAAELWAEADPHNAEPKYRVFMERWKNAKNKAELLPGIRDLIKTGGLDSYFAERSAAYDYVIENNGLEKEIGISPMDANDTNSKAMNLVNLLSAFSTEGMAGSLEGKEQLAGITAGVARQLADKKALKLVEYQCAIAAELQALRQLDGQTEFDREGFTVAERITELQQKSAENMAMSHACMDAVRSDPFLSKLFNERESAFGEYEAYRQIYELINKDKKDNK